MDVRTDEIVNRFKDSWTKTESFYDDLIKNYPGFERLKPVRQFISQLRDNEEFNNFRLGTSMHTLVISRSVDHGLRRDQKYIKIETFDNSDFEVTFRDGDKTYRKYIIKNLGDTRLIKLLDTLRDTLVD